MVLLSAYDVIQSDDQVGGHPRSRRVERILIWCSYGTTADIFELSRGNAD